MFVLCVEFGIKNIMGSVPFLKSKVQIAPMAKSTMLALAVCRYREMRWSHNYEHCIGLKWCG